MLRQPSPTTKSGGPLSVMPVVNLVDSFNNSILETGWHVVVSITKLGAPKPYTLNS
jgi:hypothetical protein